jgi:hypothetical protein
MCFSSFILSAIPNNPKQKREGADNGNETPEEYNAFVKWQMFHKGFRRGERKICKGRVMCFVVRVGAPD